MRFRLPTTATAPFCPSEVRGSVAFDPGLSTWRKLLRMAGPGLLVSVGYMDPGNWATDIEAGSRFGYDLLFVVICCSVAAMVLQTFSLRLGIVAGKDLAQVSSEQYSKPIARIQWLLAELSIIACDLAEVLGCALAFHLLLGVSLPTGVGLTALDTIIVLGLKGKNFRDLEAIMLGLIVTIGLCFLIELILVGPDWSRIVAGSIPSWEVLKDRDALYLAVGVMGATVMPHNLYLHSSIVQTRVVGESDRSKREAIGWSRLDTIVSLTFAMLINAAIMILAAAAFHDTGLRNVADIEDAHELLAPIVGTGAASVLFAIALLASGQSSTFTGTIAGQIIMEGFLKLKIPCYQRRLITRGLALIPAFIGVSTMGENAVGRLLVMTQVVLSLQLPFALYPLLRFTSSREIMGVHATRLPMQLVGWSLFALITAANLWLLLRLVSE